MSATTLSNAGLEAIEKRNWQDAITNLSKAIEQTKSPAWLIARAQAYLEAGHPDKALRDAEYAYCVAAERGNDKSRKHMVEATYRRAVIYFRNKQYANAAKLALWSQRLAEGAAVKSAAEVMQETVDENGFYHMSSEEAMAQNKKKKDPSKAKANLSDLLGAGGPAKEAGSNRDLNKAQTLFTTVIGFLEALPADDPARKVSVALVPTKPSLEESEDNKSIDVKKSEIEASKAGPAQPAPKPKVETASQPFRSQMYQSDSSITATLFMKFASKEDMSQVRVDIQPNLITATGVPRDPSTLYLIPHAAIDPTKSTFRVAQMKIEFTLAKAVPEKWPSVGREEMSPPESSSLPSVDAQSTTADKPATPASIETSKAPAYPTSSKSGPKNWETLAKDEDEGEGDPNSVDSFFQNLFKNSTPEQQRAMMKSFTESNGTALSTDWDTVSKGPVETRPPEGVEAKKWSS